MIKRDLMDRGSRLVSESGEKIVDFVGDIDLSDSQFFFWGAAMSGLVSI